MLPREQNPTVNAPKVTQPAQPPVPPSNKPRFLPGVGEPVKPKPKPVQPPSNNHTPLPKPETKITYTTNKEGYGYSTKRTDIPSLFPTKSVYYFGPGSTPNGKITPSFFPGSTITTINPIRPPEPKLTIGQKISQAMGNMGKNIWFGKETGPEQVAMAPDVKLEYGPSSKMILAESISNIGLGFTTGNVIKIASGAAENASGLWKRIYQGSKVGMFGSTAVGLGADVGVTAFNVQKNRISNAELRNKILQTGLGFASFGYALGGKGFSELNKTFWEPDVNRIDYSGFNKQTTGRHITEIDSLKSYEPETTALDEPYTEEFLRKQYHENPSIQSRGLSEQDFIKTYQGTTPREYLLRAKLLQRNVRTGATWIENKALMNNKTLRNLVVEGKVSKMNKLDSFERLPEVATEGTMGLEFTETNMPKTTLKVSKPFEFMGENRLPTTPKSGVEKLIAQVGSKPSKNLLGLPENDVAPQKGQPFGFGDMDELGGFKNMYGKNTVMVFEDESEPVISNRWGGIFRNKPSRSPTRLNYVEPRTNLRFGEILSPGVGSLFGQHSQQIEHGLQLDIQGNIQAGMLTPGSTQSQLNRQVITQRNILGISTQQNQRQEQLQNQLQQQLLRQETISVPFTRSIHHRNPRPVNPVIVPPPPIPDDVVSFSSKGRRVKQKKMRSLMKVESLPIPTLKNLFGG